MDMQYNFAGIQQLIHNYKVLDMVGRGSFGVCYKVQNKINNKYHVWKVVNYETMTDSEKKLLVTEVNLMNSLRHPFIVDYCGKINDKKNGILFIMMEWCENGDLNSVIQRGQIKNRFIDETFIWKILYQTARALEACHSLLKNHTVLHRDIKPANIFLDRKFNVRLGDFGLAKILDKNASFSNTVVGTPYYMSPEQIQGSQYNKKSDIWALGCLIYELCCLKQPFRGNNIKELRKNIIENKFDDIPANYSEYLYSMIKLLLKSNYEFRPSVEVIVHHPSVVINYDKNATPFNNNSQKHNYSFYDKKNLHEMNTTPTISSPACFNGNDDTYFKGLMHQMKSLLVRSPYNDRLQKEQSKIITTALISEKNLIKSTY